MQLRNTDYNYGAIAKTFHWLTALLFLLSYVSVYYRQWFTQEQTPENWTALQLHLSIGVSVAVIVALRIIWRIYDQEPDKEPGTRIEHLAARAGHYALYAIMIIMPITGYLGTGANTDYFFLFEITKFENTALFQSLFHEGLGIAFEDFEKPIDFIHKNLLGEWLVWLLIVGHAAAAMYHHFVKQDRTLRKMTSGQ